MSPIKKTLFCMFLFFQAMMLISLNEAYGYFAVAVLFVAFALINYVILRK